MLGFAVPALALSHPSRPVKVVVPFPGRGLDFTARLLADKLEASTKQPFVASKPGASGIRTVMGAKAAADGYASLHVLDTRLYDKIAIAVSSPQRTQSARDVLTMVESGYSGFDVRFYKLMGALARIPEPIRFMREPDIQHALRAPDLRSRRHAQMPEPFAGTNVETSALIKTATERWPTVIKTADVRLDLD